VKAVLLLSGIVLLSGCGGSGGGLEVTRADGSTVGFRPHLRAWCGAYDPFEAASGQPRALHVALGAFPPRRADPQSLLFVTHKLSDLAKSRTVVIGEDEDLATAFVFDAKTQNEAASNLHGASGSVRFREVACRPDAMVKVSLDATLVSENGKAGPVRVKGDLATHIDAK
jgi:hypothetical protein